MNVDDERLFNSCKSQLDMLEGSGDSIEMPRESYKRLLGLGGTALVIPATARPPSTYSVDRRELKRLIENVDKYQEHKTREALRGADADLIVIDDVGEVSKETWGVTVVKDRAGKWRPELLSDVDFS